MCWPAGERFLARMIGVSTSVSSGLSIGPNSNSLTEFSLRSISSILSEFLLQPISGVLTKLTGINISVTFPVCNWIILCFVSKVYDVAVEYKL